MCSLDATTTVSGLVSAARSRWVKSMPLRFRSERGAVRGAPWRDPARTTKSVGGRVDAAISANHGSGSITEACEVTLHDRSGLPSLWGACGSEGSHGGGEVLGTWALRAHVKPRADLPFRGKHARQGI